MEDPRETVCGRVNDGGEEMKQKKKKKKKQMQKGSKIDDMKYITDIQYINL